jgi:molybdopterin converting factor small subunit
MAQSVTADEERGKTLARIEELLRLEGERRERVHLREETLLALGTGTPAGETLALARQNFAAQREAIDARLLARAAVNARDDRALRELREWRDSTGFEDRLVDHLLSETRS